MMAAVKGEFTAPPRNHNRQHSGRSWVESLALPLIAFLFIVGKLGSLRRLLGAIAGGILLPVLMAFFMKSGFLLTLAMIPVGLFVGFLISMISGGFSGSRYSHGGYWGGGGFSSGGSGGFSGGDGGFGGGGSSGEW
jgi:uncharacterized protein